MDKKAITTALRILFQAGDVFEIRVLDAVLPHSNWQHTESGYFDYEHIDDVPNCLANYQAYGGVYVTLNPVNPQLLARANNRLKKARAQQTTSDQDIVRRRWMLVDVDPVRPAGISATEAERSLSFDKAAEIAGDLEARGFPGEFPGELPGELQGEGFPGGMCVNSGNGTQLLYRVDLPADDDGLVRRCLQQLSRYSTDQVNVDVSVHNPARICRLPGTWNCKGDSTETRPHRLAEILDKPKVIQPVPTALLEQLADCDLPVKGDDPQTPTADLQQIDDRQAAVRGGIISTIEDYNQRGDLAAILERHGWTLKSENEQQYWWRPGKTSGQHSATFDGTVFYVFSDNAQPFEAGKGYNRFGVYKTLEYDGDDCTAIDALTVQGYGVAENGVDLSGILDKLCNPGESESQQLPAGIEVVSLKQLRSCFEGLNKPIVHGLLREGETMNFIAAPKVGKSWLALRLAISVASGMDWLGFRVEPGKVLHIDNELHRNLITDRYNTVCEAMEVNPKLLDEQIDVISLRGDLRDIVSIGQICRALQHSNYKLVILDAFYRTLPSGTDENDNGAMAGIYNMIDRYTSLMNCGFVLIHHSSKGNQSGKAVTDVGAGAGTQARAADTHLVIRPHEEQDIFVMEANIRSWAPIEPMALHWQWPLFTPTGEVDTTQLKGIAKPKPKKKAPEVEEFVATCIKPFDPCSQVSIQYEATQQLNMSEYAAKSMLNLALERDDVVKIKVGSRMKYVVKRAGISGDKALHIAALLEKNPAMSNSEIVQRSKISRQYVHEIRRDLGMIEEPEPVKKGVN